MKNSQKGFANIILIVAVVILAGALGYVTLVKKSNIAENAQPAKNTTIAETPTATQVTSSEEKGRETSTKAVNTYTPPVTPTTTTTPKTPVFPPNGWYVYNHSDIPDLQTSMMLTKQKTSPTGYCEGTEGACFGEQIVISVSTTTLTPETYIAQIVQGGVYPSNQKWSTRNGFKIFSMTYTTDANTTPTDGQYFFIGNSVYQFSLYPSEEKNRSDFQQVVNYYATKSL